MLKAANEHQPEIVKVFAEAQNIDLRNAWYQLMIAIAAEDFTAFRAVTNSNTSYKQYINKTDPEGRTALILAASIGKPKQLDMLQVLTQLPGIDMDYRNKQGETALLCAIAKGSSRVVNILLDAPKINLEVRDDKGHTALEMALSLATDVKSSQDEIAAQLVQKGALFKQELLFDAIRLKLPCLTKALLSQKCDANQTNWKHQTPLWAAFELEDAELISILLKAGADANRVEVPVAAPSPHSAAASDEPDPFALTPEEASTLSAAEGATDVQDTLLMRAIRKNKKEIALILISHGVDLNATNSRGETAASLCQKLNRSDLWEPLQAATLKQAARPAGDTDTLV